MDCVPILYQLSALTCKVQLLASRKNWAVSRSAPGTTAQNWSSRTSRSLVFIVWIMKLYIRQMAEEEKTRGAQVYRSYHGLPQESYSQILAHTYTCVQTITFSHLSFSHSFPFPLLFHAEHQEWKIWVYAHCIFSYAHRKHAQKLIWISHTG